MLRKQVGFWPKLKNNVFFVLNQHDDVLRTMMMMMMVVGSYKLIIFRDSNAPGICIRQTPEQRCSVTMHTS